MNDFECLSGRCYSPMACGGFGYCRERNFETKTCRRCGEKMDIDCDASGCRDFDCPIQWER